MVLRAQLLSPITLQILQYGRHRENKNTKNRGKIMMNNKERQQHQQF
jgi:hypothetical protein